MAKKFMFVSLGILALAAAFHLGAEYGHADYVDHSSTGIVGVSSFGANSAMVLLDTGQVYSFSTSWGYLLQEMKTPPVPVSQIKFWADGIIVTTSNEIWSQDGPWTNYGSPPGLTITQPATWGRIKAGFTK